VTTIAVVDHGAGNLVSIGRGLESAGARVVVASDPEEFSGADALVLPGVGATGAAMERLDESGMIEAIRTWPGPLLGICVGMQLFFDASDEADNDCLGLIPGRVCRLGATPLPHMGWNDVAHNGDPIFRDIPEGTTFYFVHSYAPVPRRAETIIGTADYGEAFTAAVRQGRRVGVQFHPERSGPAGLQLLANFVASVETPSVEEQR